MDEPKNRGYCATVVRVKTLVKCINSDNLQAIPMFGLQAIVDMQTQVGDLGVFFPAETQLAYDLCYANNLHRHGTNNYDQSKQGYLDDNRRVRAIKLRGNVSNGLFLPLESLAYTKADLSKLNEGDEFDMLNGKEVCRKYTVQRMQGSGEKHPRKQEKTFTRVDPRMLPEHYDTDNYFKYYENYNPESEVIVTQKLHGTSIRIAHIPVRRKLSLLERIAKRFGAKPQEEVYDMVYGSHKVIKDINNPYQNHFYDIDIWTEKGSELVGLIPKNYIIYGELIGFTSGGRPIQERYTYDLPASTSRLHVYRVAVINPDGLLTDLSYDQTVEFCDSIGVDYVRELWRGKLKDFKAENWIDIKFAESGKQFGATLPGLLNAVPLSKDSPVDEGVCVRFEGLRPKILKAKGPKFYEHETKQLDNEVVDLEAEESE